MTKLFILVRHWLCSRINLVRKI